MGRADASTKQVGTNTTGHQQSQSGFLTIVWHLNWGFSLTWIYTSGKKSTRGITFASCLFDFVEQKQVLSLGICWGNLPSTTLKASFMFGDRLINITGQVCSLHPSRRIKIHEWLRNVGLGRISLFERGVLANGCSVMFKESLMTTFKETKLIYKGHSPFVSLQSLLLL